MRQTPLPFSLWFRFVLLGLGLTIPACLEAAPNCNSDYANLTFAQIDTNQDEKISVDEYISIFKKGGANILDQNAWKRTFTGYDKNTDQVVNQSEFNAIADKNTQKLAFTFGGCAKRDLSSQF